MSIPERLKRPRAETQEIADLAEDARSGKFVLPDFQRDLRWKMEDRIKLFDSIYRGFPIGNILFWEPISKKPRGRHDFGPYTSGIEHANPWFVVDGQQRLATLLGCMLIAPRQEDDEAATTDSATTESTASWRLAFNTDSLNIVALPLRATPELLPLPVALDTAQYLEWTRQLPEHRRSERLKAADDFSRSLRTYRVPYYVVRTDDRSALQEVFERTNNSGRSLKIEDVFNGLFRGEDGPGLAELVQLVEDLGFGTIDEALIAQAAAMLAGLNPARKMEAELRRLDKKDAGKDPTRSARERLRTIYPELHRWLREAVEFLQATGFKRIEVLPHDMVIPLLMLVFARFPDLDGANSVPALQRWIWLLSAGGARTLHRSTYLRTATRVIRRAESAEAAVAGLEQLSPVRLEGLADDIVESRFSLNNNTAKLVVLALFSLNPVDLVRGESIDLWSGLEVHRERLFRPLFAGASAAEGRTFVNRIVDDSGVPSPAGPSLLMQLKGLSESERARRLQTQCISGDAIQALARDDAAGFLRIRHAQLRDTIDEFIRSKLGT